MTDINLIEISLYSDFLCNFAHISAKQSIIWIFQTKNWLFGKMQSKE